MDLSERGELSGTSEVLRPIAGRARELGIPWLLIGAAARDILLYGMRGWKPSRRTIDVDVAVHVGTWGEFHALQRLLVSEDGGQLHPELKQRIGLPASSVDIVPCCGVSPSPDYS